MSEHKLIPREYALAQVRRMCAALADFSGRNELTKPMTPEQVEILQDGLTAMVGDVFDLIDEQAQP